jgi:hypothetical protein
MTFTRCCSLRRMSESNKKRENEIAYSLFSFIWMKLFYGRFTACFHSFVRSFIHCVCFNLSCFCRSTLSQEIKEPKSGFINDGSQVRLARHFSTFLLHIRSLFTTQINGYKKASEMNLCRRI